MGNQSPGSGYIPISLCDAIAVSFFLFHLFLSTSVIHHHYPLANMLIVQKSFSLAVPGLSLFVACSPFELFRKCLQFLLVYGLELFVYFSVTSCSRLVWWHSLQVVFSCLISRYFYIFLLSFDLFGMGGNCQNIQPFSSFTSLSPPNFF